MIHEGKEYEEIIYRQTQMNQTPEAIKNSFRGLIVYRSGCTSSQRKPRIQRQKGKLHYQRREGAGSPCGN